MGDLVLMFSISLDGYIEGPNREIDWHRVDEEVHSYFNQVLGAAGAFFEGRVTHMMMADFWPTADQDPESPPAIVEFARIWREKPKYMASRTIESADWNTTVIRDVTPERIAALKSEIDGDIVVGGADFAASLLEHELIDRFHICVHPVVIGAGKPLFPRDAWLDLNLIDTRRFGNGVVLLHYERSQRSSASSSA